MENNPILYLQSKIYEAYLTCCDQFYEYYMDLYESEINKYCRSKYNTILEIELKDIKNKLKEYDEDLFRLNIDKFIIGKFGIGKDIKLDSIGTLFKIHNAESSDEIFERILHYAIPVYLYEPICDYLRDICNINVKLIDEIISEFNS